MNAATLHYCRVRCAGRRIPAMALCAAHLIVDHKRKMIEADVLLVKYIDLTKPIPEIDESTLPRLVHRDSRSRPPK